MALEGSCVVRVEDKTYMIGGKDEKGIIHDAVWILDVKDTSKGLATLFFHGKYH